MVMRLNLVIGGTRGLPIIRIQNLTNQNTVPNYFDGPYNPKFEVNKEIF